MKNTRTKVFHRWVKLMAELMVAESQSLHLTQTRAIAKPRPQEACCPNTGGGTGTQLQGTMDG